MRTIIRDARYVWVLLRWNLRGILIVAAILTFFGLLGLWGYLEFIAMSRTHGSFTASVVRITQVPRPGKYAAGASLWRADVKMKSGQTVEAEFRAMPIAGQEVCIVKISSPFKGEQYQALGLIDAMSDKGVVCSVTSTDR